MVCTAARRRRGIPHTPRAERCDRSAPYIATCASTQHDTGVVISASTKRCDRRVLAIKYYRWATSSATLHTASREVFIYATTLFRFGFWRGRIGRGCVRVAGCLGIAVSMNSSSWSSRPSSATMVARSPRSTIAYLTPWYSHVADWRKQVLPKARRLGVTTSRSCTVLQPGLRFRAIRAAPSHPPSATKSR